MGVYVFLKLLIIFLNNKVINDWNKIPRIRK